MVLGDVDDLSDVIRIVGQLSSYRLKHSQRLTSYGDGPIEIGITEWFERREQSGPTGFPLLKQAWFRVAGNDLEFVVAIPTRFFAVAGQEVSPSRQ